MEYSHFKNKNILITGGLGFIGSNLAKLLVSLEAKVTLVDSLIANYGGNIRNIDGFQDKLVMNISDVRDTHSLKRLLPSQDYLFNLAGQTSHIDSMLDPKTDIDINAVSQISILECCREFNPNIKIIFASTRQIYGRPQYLPVDEMHPIKPVDVNGINKWAGEAYHSLYYDVYGIRSCSLRLTNTYGPNMRIRDARQTFLGVWFKNLILNQTLDIYGDGEQLRDFNYVEDVIHAMLLAAESESSNGHIFNLGSSEIVSLKQLASMITGFVNTKNYRIVDFPDDRKKIDIGNYYSDYSKIEKVLGWSPKTRLSVGLAKTYEYFLANHSYYLDGDK